MVAFIWLSDSSVRSERISCSRSSLIESNREILSCNLPLSFFLLKMVYIKSNSYFLLHIFQSINILNPHLLQSHSYHLVDLFQPGSSSLKIIATLLLSHAVYKFTQFCLFQYNTLEESLNLLFPFGLLFFILVDGVSGRSHLFDIISLLQQGYGALRAVVNLLGVSDGTVLAFFVFVIDTWIILLSRFLPIQNLLRF